MRYRVEFTTRAARDLNRLYQHLNVAANSQAARWFNGLEAAVLTLERLPRRCPVAPESKKAKRSLRHLLYGNKPYVYRVIYEIDEQNKAIWVLTIRHGERETARGGEL